MISRKGHVHSLKHYSNISGLGEFYYLSGVIPAKAGHAVKHMRYPERKDSKALDARLRGHDIKITPMPE